MWMIMHLKSPNYDAAGVMFPGVPLVNLGFNGKIAWGATMVMADTQDIFLERLRTEDGRACYEYKGECVPVIEREERFAVNGSATQTRIIKSTIHGPLLNEALKEVTSSIDSPIVPVSASSPYGLALRWTISDGDKGPVGLYSIGLAGDIKEARKAFSFQKSHILVDYALSKLIQKPGFAHSCIGDNGNGLPFSVTVERN
jgi:acyl-homoserine-lactone acylase